jgi:hypothetical protein
MTAAPAGTTTGNPGQPTYPPETPNHPLAVTSGCR